MIRRGSLRHELHALSPDGLWRFEDDRLISGAAEVSPCTLDFFERWTFARFLPGGELALAFETSQPWSEYGSYGDRYGGVQVLALRGEPATWSPVALEFDYRRHDETFLVEDMVWHPRGVLGWLREGELYVQVLNAPRGVIAWDLLPPPDSAQGLAFRFDRYGPWHTLQLDSSGRMLTAIGEDGCHVFDLELRRVMQDGQDWEPLEIV